MKIFLLITIIFYTQLGFTQTITTDRPDQTESSSTVPKKSLQIESGILFERNPFVRTILIPTSLFRIGLTHKIELRILSQIESQKINSININGVSDLEIGTKIQILKKEKLNTEIALLSHLVIPTGTFNQNNFGTINKLSIAHALNQNFNLGYNFGYNHFGNNGIITYSLALGHSFTEKLSIYIEPYGEVHPLNHIANFDTGFTYLIKGNLQFDFSFGLGLNHQMNYQSAGISWLIK